ncbi:MAG: hypothetical protein AAGM84_02550 [Pseudomonadota bacterium]
MKKLVAALSVGAFALSACVSPEVVQTTSVKDGDLSCEDIKAELVKLEEIRTEAAKGRTASGANVAAAILFWPAVIGNYSNATEALEAANKRNEVLVALAKEKRCKF